MKHERTSSVNSLDSILEALQQRIKEMGGTRKYADFLGVTPSFVSQTTKGHILPQGKILDDLGYKKVTKTLITFEKP